MLLAAYPSLQDATPRPLAIRSTTPDRRTQVRSVHAQWANRPEYRVFEVPRSMFAAFDSVALDPPTPLDPEFFRRSGATQFSQLDSTHVMVLGEHYVRVSDSTRVNIVSLDHPIVRGDLALVPWSMRCDTYLCYDQGFVSLRRGPAGWVVIARGITFST